MPTYVYRREDGTTFECFQRITADPLVRCPTTQQQVRRVISGGTGFILKGSGFYKTDYVNNGNGDADKQNQKVASDENRKSDKSPETPEPKDQKAEKATKKEAAA